MFTITCVKPGSSLTRVKTYENTEVFPNALSRRTILQRALPILHTLRMPIVQVGMRGAVWQQENFECVDTARL